MSWIRFSPVLLALCVSSCDLAGMKNREGYRVEPDAPVNTFLRVPSAVWDRIEQEYDKLEIPQKDELTDLKVTFVGLKVHLVEKTPGVLSGDNFTIPIPEGGGIIDLARYVAAGRRTFEVEFELAEPLPEAARVYFVPHYMQQTIGELVLGLQCNQAVDITSFFREKLMGKGLAVNTSDWRHLNLIGGSFVIYYYKPYDLYVSQVTFHDSRKKEMLCEHSVEND